MRSLTDCTGHEDAHLLDCGHYHPARNHHCPSRYVWLPHGCRLVHQEVSANMALSSRCYALSCLLNDLVMMSETETLSRSARSWIWLTFSIRRERKQVLHWDF